MLNYALLNNNLISKLILKSLDIFAGIYGCIYRKNSIKYKAKLLDFILINPYALELNECEKLKLAFAKGYGVVICKNAKQNVLNELYGSNYKIALELNEKTKEYSSLCDFYILKTNDLKLCENLNQPIFLSSFDDDFSLAKLANENNFAGIIVEGLINLEKLKQDYKDLELICKNPSDDKKALEYASLIINNNISSMKFKNEL